MKTGLCLIAASLAVALTGHTAGAMALPPTTRVPKAHHQRFLQEIDVMRNELDEWKQSAAGQEALEQGFRQENGILDEDAKQDELERFFLTKLGIEEAQQLNPDAEFSLNTPFTLLSDEEFAKLQTYQAPPTEDHAGSGSNHTSVHDPHADELDDFSLLAASKDWSTESKCVAAVKNQGMCGSCWAFAAVASLESANCIKTQKLALYSEQEVTSCETRSHGCNGGWPEYALKYLQGKGGACSAEAYPYKSGSNQQTGTCQASCTRQPVKITQVVNVQASDSSFVSALNKQPMAVIVAAGNNVWKQYRGGVVASCPSNQLDHAVLAVGYGEQGGKSFFKIKNSWGSNWGDKGYMYLGRSGGTAACGVLQSSGVYPAV